MDLLNGCLLLIKDETKNFLNLSQSF